MADRSTGVQQGRTYTIRVCPICGGDRVQAAHGRCANECRGPDQIIPPMVELLVEAVSPEPRPTDEELLERLRQLVADDERELGPVPESVMREVAASWPREGEQEKCDARIGERRCRLDKGHEGYHDMPAPASELSSDDETNSTTTTSVASVLRLTASCLRDPEHRWSEDPAVTLERLAEKLEKGRDDG